MSTPLDIEAQKSPEQIEREIDAQRASIGNIVDQLESKFTPGQMFDQAWGMLQNNGSTFVSNLGTSVRNNPVPAVLTSVAVRVTADSSAWLRASMPARTITRRGQDANNDTSRIASVGASRSCPIAIFRCVLSSLMSA